MREIKFRVWDNIKKLYLKEEKNEILLLSNDENTPVFKLNLSNNIYDFFEKETVEIEFFTGLKDKNDNEIYEGDIVKWENRENDVFNYAKVFFEDGAFRLYNVYFELNKYENLEVVGNIYENPEICCK